MVYEPDPHVSWPDPTLGIFAKSDEKFLLPGNVGGGLQCDEEIDDEDVLSLDDTKYSKVTGLVFHVHLKMVGLIKIFFTKEKGPEKFAILQFIEFSEH